MVKKQNSNAWLIYLIALVAIAALVLGAIAVNKANMTGQGFLDFLKAKKNVEVTPDGSVGGGQASSGECEQPAFDNCISGCEQGDPDLYWDCVKDCGDTYCSNFISDRGVMGIYFISKGGNPDVLNNYVNTIRYYDEVTGNNVKVSQSIVTDEGGHTQVTCTQTCPGGECIAIGCLPSGSFCTFGTCSGELCMTTGTCSKSVTYIPSVK